MTTIKKEKQKKQDSKEAKTNQVVKNTPKDVEVQEVTYMSDHQLSTLGWYLDSATPNWENPEEEWYHAPTLSSWMQGIDLKLKEHADLLAGDYAFLIDQSTGELSSNLIDYMVAIFGGIDYTQTGYYHSSYDDGFPRLAEIVDEMDSNIHNMLDVQSTGYYLVSGDNVAANLGNLDSKLGEVDSDLSAVKDDLGDKDGTDWGSTIIGGSPTVWGALATVAYSLGPLETNFSELSGQVETIWEYLGSPREGSGSYIDPSYSAWDNLYALDSSLFDLSSKYEVTLSARATAATGYLATYDFHQGGVLKGTINIPKDFLVKSAALSTVTTADVPYSGAVVGDKYIDFVINAKDNSETAQHIYLPVNDLVDVYTAQQNATQVQLAINANNVISASIVAGSIGTTELSNLAVTTAKIANDAVTSAKILSAAVVTDKIADNAVTSAKILSAAVTTAKIADEAVTTSKLSALDHIILTDQTTDTESSNYQKQWKISIVEGRLIVEDYSSASL